MLQHALQLCRIRLCYTSSGHRLGMPILCSRLRHVHVLLHHRPGRFLGFRDGDAYAARAEGDANWNGQSLGM